MKEWKRDEIEPICERIVAQMLTEGPLKGGHPSLFEAKPNGVVAFERMQTMGRDDLDWDEAARRIAKATGHTVVAVVDCDWSFDDRCDEEATFLAFDVPDLEDGYDDKLRNKLHEPAVAA